MWHIPANVKRMSSKADKIKDISHKKVQQGKSKRIQILKGRGKAIVLYLHLLGILRREELSELNKKLSSQFDASCFRALDHSKPDKAEQKNHN